METQPAPVTATLTTEIKLTTQERGHHKYGPSKLNYLNACAGFKSNDGTSDAAEQGTFLHDLMEGIIQQVIQKKAATCVEQLSGWVTKNNELADDEIEYLRFACKRCDVFFSRKPDAVHTEIDVHVRNEDSSAELNHGYLDVLFVFKNTGILIDFKFGWEPVTPAPTNLQGQNYAIGCFQKFTFLDQIGVEFIQPKLNWVTSTLFHRKQMAEIYDRLNGVIQNAEYLQTNPADAQKYMKPGSYCKYCAHTACAMLANHRAVMVSKFKGLPVPPSFQGVDLRTPEEVALARYWVEIADTLTSEIKTKSLEMAEANGGSISCTLPDGSVILYEICEKNADRKLGSAVEIAEAFKESISPQEILGAAELALGKFETIAKTALTDLAKATGGEKLTKKAAWEQAVSTLEAHGLLTRPDGKIRFLKLKKNAVKQIEEQK